MLILVLGALHVSQQEQFPELDGCGRIRALKLARHPNRKPECDHRKNDTVLLLIEPQADFHSIMGSSPIAGAEEDTHSFAELIRDHISKIDGIVVVLDSHQVRVATTYI
jgi:hypothetical protein